MPCNTKTYISMELAVANRELLKKAMGVIGLQNIQIGYDGVTLHARTADYKSVTVYKDRIQVEEGQEGIVKQIKMQYGRECVKQEALKTGWTVKWKSPTQGVLVKNGGFGK